MSTRQAFALFAEYLAAIFIGLAVTFLIFWAAAREDARGIHGDLPAPRGSAATLGVLAGKAAPVDACSWSDTASQWLRRDGALCRGTGEDPVFMPDDTVTDVPDLWANLDHSALYVEEDSLLWDCRIDGDQVCGYGNSTGVTAGYYGTNHGIFS